MFGMNSGCRQYFLLLFCIHSNLGKLDPANDYNLMELAQNDAVCPDGLYKAPSIIVCQPCDCNNNIDINSIRNCDPSTGVCLKCIYNTTGSSCEHCLPGYYGNALSTEKCRSCDCSKELSELDSHGSKLDDLIAGQCHCEKNVVHTQNHKCEDGYFRLPNTEDCQRCECDSNGSVSQSCEMDTGKCICKKGVTGIKCNRFDSATPDSCSDCYNHVSTKSNLLESRSTSSDNILNDLKKLVNMTNDFKFKVTSLHNESNQTIDNMLLKTKEIDPKLEDILQKLRNITENIKIAEENGTILGEDFDKLRKRLEISNRELESITVSLAKYNEKYNNLDMQYLLGNTTASALKTQQIIQLNTNKFIELKNAMENAISLIDLSDIAKKQQQLHDVEKELSGINVLWNFFEDLTENATDVNEQAADILNKVSGLTIPKYDVGPLLVNIISEKNNIEVKLKEFQDDIKKTNIENNTLVDLEQLKSFEAEIINLLEKWQGLLELINTFDLNADQIEDALKSIRDEIENYTKVFENTKITIVQDLNVTNSYTELKQKVDEIESSMNNLFPEMDNIMKLLDFGKLEELESKVNDSERSMIKSFEDEFQIIKNDIKILESEAAHLRTVVNSLPPCAVILDPES